MRNTAWLILAMIASLASNAGRASATSGVLTVTPMPGNPLRVVARVDLTNDTCVRPSACDQPFVDITVTPCPPGKTCTNGTYRSHHVIQNDPTYVVEETIDLSPGVSYQFGGTWVFVAFDPPIPGGDPTICWYQCATDGTLNNVQYPSTLSVGSAPGPAAARLEPAGPNPFRNDTGFTLWLPRPAPVRVGVYDAAGRRVRLLFDDRLPAGSLPLRWDGRDALGGRVRAGLYVVRAIVGETRLTARLLRVD